MKYIFIFFILILNNNAEKIITAKNDQPDSYFGLKLGAVVSPSYGFVLRDKYNGTNNARKDDRTGFSSPWTLLMMSKEWEEKNISVEFWGEILRSSNFSSDTNVDQNPSSKSNPYILSIRRANVKKNWQIKSSEIQLIFGIQELPHTYTQWQGNWSWRYVDRAPLESMGFSPQAADLGISGIHKWKNLNSQLSLVNGEGYREIQNTNSSGLDLVGRVSFEPSFFDSKLKLGIHGLGRLGNIIGITGNECREGVSTCNPSDRNVVTRLEKDLRHQKSETFALETTLLVKNQINLGFGILARKQFQGITYDRADLSKYPIFNPDLKMNGSYIWIGLLYKDFQFVFRHENGSGRSGILSQTVNPDWNGTQYYYRNLFFLEYNYSDSARFSFGGSTLQNYNSLNGKEKVYIDTIGEQRTESEYYSQFNSQNRIPIISAYSITDRQLFIRSTFDF
jgi:hypothetical protein